MTNEELLAETSIRLNETGEEFYRDLRLVLLPDDKGPEYDLRVLISAARTLINVSIEKDDKIYFLCALNFLQEYRFKKIDSELRELRDELQDAAWEADLADDS